MLLLFRRSLTPRLRFLLPPIRSLAPAPLLPSLHPLCVAFSQHIVFGNRRSHSEMKTRRTWSPNVQIKTFQSQVLGRSCRFNVTAKAIRCIDKAGGFDNYILRTKDEYLGYAGSRGVELKHAML